MSDTVKLIVTLSKGQYEALKDIQFGGIGSRMIFNAVKHGILLDDVKAEIESLPTEKNVRCRKAYIFASEFKPKVLEIIDKHISREGDK